MTYSVGVQVLLTVFLPAVRQELICKAPKISSAANGSQELDLLPGSSRELYSALQKLAGLVHNCSEIEGACLFLPNA